MCMQSMAPLLLGGAGDPADARLLEAEAARAREAAGRRADRLTREGEGRLAALRARQGASGIDLSSGSALATGQSAALGEAGPVGDALLAGANEADSLLARAADARARARRARDEARLRPATQLLGGLANWLF